VHIELMFDLIFDRKVSGNIKYVVRPIVLLFVCPVYCLGRLLCDDKAHWIELFDE